MSDDKQPLYCGANIEGPKVGRNVVLWRKSCRQRVKAVGDRCRFHGGPEANARTRLGLVGF
jgi:hypothetical protein